MYTKNNEFNEQGCHFTLYQPVPPSYEPELPAVDIMDLPFEQYLAYYLNRHEKTYCLGPTMSELRWATQRYFFPYIGGVSLRYLTVDMLHKCFHRVYMRGTVPVCLLIGFSKLLEIAFDYGIECGYFSSNPARELAAAHNPIPKLPYSQYPAVLTHRDKKYECFNKENDSIVIPGLTHLYYVGRDLHDGKVLLCHALRDELLLNPKTPEPPAVSSIQLKPNQELILLNLH